MHHSRKVLIMSVMKAMPLIKRAFTVHLADCWYLVFCSELSLSLRLYWLCITSRWRRGMRISQDSLLCRKSAWRRKISGRVLIHRYWLFSLHRFCWQVCICCLLFRWFLNCCCYLGWIGHSFWQWWHWDAIWCLQCSILSFTKWHPEFIIGL